MCRPLVSLVARGCESIKRTMRRRVSSSSAISHHTRAFLSLISRYVAADSRLDQPTAIGFCFRAGNSGAALPTTVADIAVSTNPSRRTDATINKILTSYILSQVFLWCTTSCLAATFELAHLGSVKNKEEILQRNALKRESYFYPIMFLQVRKVSISCPWWKCQGVRSKGRLLSLRRLAREATEGFADALLLLHFVEVPMVRRM